MQLAAVRVGLGLAVVASGALVGFLFLRDRPEVAPAAPPSPPRPPPAPAPREIPTAASRALPACVSGVFVDPHGVMVRVGAAWLSAATLARANKRPRMHAVDGDLDPRYVTRDLALLDRDGHPIEALRALAPREPALSGQGQVVQVHDLDDPDETPCAQQPASVTVWRTDPMIVQVRYNVAAGCPDVCVVLSAPRPASLGAP
jgi:hypothetical protein